MVKLVGSGSERPTNIIWEARSPAHTCWWSATCFFWTIFFSSRYPWFFPATSTGCV